MAVDVLLEQDGLNNFLHHLAGADHAGFIQFEDIDGKTTWIASRALVALAEIPQPAPRPEKPEITTLQAHVADGPGGESLAIVGAHEDWHTPVVRIYTALRRKGLTRDEVCEKILEQLDIRLEIAAGG